MRFPGDMESLKLIGLDRRSASYIREFLSDLRQLRLLNLDEHEDIVERCGRHVLPEETALFNEMCLRLAHRNNIAAFRSDRGLVTRISDTMSLIRDYLKTNAFSDPVDRAAALTETVIISLDKSELCKIAGIASGLAQKEASAGPLCVSDRGLVCLKRTDLSAIEDNLQKAKDNILSYKILPFRKINSEKPVIVNLLNSLVYMCMLGIHVIDGWEDLERSFVRHVNRCRLALLSIMLQKRGFGAGYLANLMGSEINGHNAEDISQRLSDDLCVFEDALRPNVETKSGFLGDKHGGARSEGRARKRGEAVSVLKHVDIKHVKHAPCSIKNLSGCDVLSEHRYTGRSCSRRDDRGIDIAGVDRAHARLTGKNSDGVPYGCGGRDNGGQEPDLNTRAKGRDSTVSFNACREDVTDSVDEIVDGFGKNRCFYGSDELRDSKIEESDDGSSCDSDGSASHILESESTQHLDVEDVTKSFSSCAVDDGSTFRNDRAGSGTEYVDVRESDSASEGSGASRFVFVPPHVDASRTNSPFYAAHNAEDSAVREEGLDDTPGDGGKGVEHIKQIIKHIQGDK